MLTYKHFIQQNSLKKVELIYCLELEENFMLEMNFIEAYFIRNLMSC